MLGKMLVVTLMVVVAICFIKAEKEKENPAFRLDPNAQWVYHCKNDLCERTMENVTNNGCALPIQEPSYPSVEVCRLVCGSYGALLPKPTDQVHLNKTLRHLDPNNISYELYIDSTEKLILEDFIAKNMQMFRENVASECANRNCSTPTGLTSKLRIEIFLQSSSIDLNHNTDEEYSVNVVENSTHINVKITAPNFFGARHGLETLSQLIASYTFTTTECGTVSPLVMTSNAQISDSPSYKHRGLLLDTARNFLSVATMKRQIDAMAASKMNVLHWHATDSQSFPFESISVPEFTKFGAFSPEKIYTPQDTADILEYAKTRGVRVIMEIDAPAHAGNGWQWGPSAGLGELSLCVNKRPYTSYCIEPPCGQLNPINSNVTILLRNLYKDILDLFPKQEFFHMGGDEVFIPCWNSSQQIKDYLTNLGLPLTKSSFLDLWGQFQVEALKEFDVVAGNSNAPIILWSSELTSPDAITKYLSNERYIIQTWVPSADPLVEELLALDYKLIISTKDAWYLDHGFWGKTVYYQWSTVYNNKLPVHDNVLGGEVCSWGEYIDEEGLDARIWPRGAAAAERLWSNPETGHRAAYPRMQRHRNRLVKRGIAAQALVTEWCYFTEGECP